jgi:hypothetical protein
MPPLTNKDAYQLTCPVSSEARRLPERGAASLVFIILFLPFLLILLVISIDIATFFSVREGVRALLDDEAQWALARSHTPSQAQESIKRKMGKLASFLKSPTIKATVQPNASVLSIKANYHGVLIDLCGDFLREQLPAIPIDIEVRSRRFSSSALIVFDRTVADVGIECSDPELRDVKNFVGTLVAALESAGVDSVRVGFTPGVRGVIDVLEAVEGLQGCDGVSLISARQVENVPGVARVLPQPTDLGAEIEQLVLTRRSVSPAERFGLVTVVRGRRAGDGYIHSTIDVLDSMSRQHQLFLNMVHFGINASGSYQRPPYRPSFYGVRWREVLLQTSQLSDPRLLAASLGHLGNDVHISR